MQEFIFAGGKDPLFSTTKKSIYQNDVNPEARNRGIVAAQKLESLRMRHTEPDKAINPQEMARRQWESNTYHLLVRDSKIESTLSDLHYEIAETIRNIDLHFFASPFVDNLRHLIPHIEHQITDLESEIKLLFTNIYQHLINPSLGLVKDKHDLRSHHSKLGFFELIKQIIASNLNKYRGSIHSIEALRNYLCLPDLYKSIVQAFEHLRLGQAIDYVHEKFSGIMQDYFVLPFMRLQEVSVVSARHW